MDWSSIVLLLCCCIVSADHEFTPVHSYETYTTGCLWFSSESSISDDDCPRGHPYVEAYGKDSSSCGGFYGTYVYCRILHCIDGYYEYKENGNMGCRAEECQNSALALPNGYWTEDRWWLSHATFYCNPGYELVGENIARCRYANGAVSYDPSTFPTCVDIDECSTLSPCEHTCTNTAGGYQCGCNSGHVLESDGHACKGVFCNTIEDPLNGVFHYASLDPVTGEAVYPSTAELACDPGYEETETRPLQCNEDGLWVKTWLTGPASLDQDHTDMSCPGATCDVLEPLVDGTIVWSTNRPGAANPPTAQDPARYGDSAIFKCDEGYELSSTEDVVLCGSSGSWSLSPIPTCRGLSCPALPAPQNGVVQYEPPNREYPSTATVVCATGFMAVPDEPRDCGVDGAWGGSDTIVCEGVACSVSDIPTNSKAAVEFTNGKVFPSFAIFTCQDDYYSVQSLSYPCDGATEVYTSSGGAAVCELRRVDTVIVDATGTSTLQTTAGNQQLVISGILGLSSSTGVSVFFGPAEDLERFECAVVSVSPPNSVRCTQPAGYGSDLTLSLQLPFQGSSLRFTTTQALHYPTPLITANSLQGTPGTLSQLPGFRRFQSDSVFGGDQLTIHGQHFTELLSVPKVTLRSTRVAAVFPCTVTAVTDATIECTTVPGDGGPYNLFVDVGGQLSDASADEFAYAPGPSIAFIESDGCTNIYPRIEECPTDALHDGGGRVYITIVGSSFMGANGRLPVVTVGERPCPLRVFNDTYIECGLPTGKGLARTVSIQVGDKASVPVPLVGYKAPQITDVVGCDNRLNCDRAGVDVITIRGRYFGGSNALVLVSGTECRGTTHTFGKEQSELTCTLAAGRGLGKIVSVFQDNGRISFAANSLALGYLECVPGTREEADGLGCALCPPGRLSIRHSASECTLCPLGWYQPASGQKTCIQANVGSYVDVEGSNSSMLCAAGTFTAVAGKSVCTSCEAGSAQNFTGRSSCPPCGLGRYQPFEGERLCLECPTGKAGSGYGLAVCSTCPVGSVAERTGQVTCNQCVAGRYPAGPAECRACPPGKAAPNDGALECEECGVGEYQNATGQLACLACAPGTYQGASASPSCLLCIEGRYSPEYGAAVCIDAPVGTSVPLNGSSDSTMCGVGTYADTKGSAVCKLCERGRAASGNLSTSCAPCPKGYAQPEEGKAECIICSQGTIADTTGSPACTPCPAGTFTLVGKSDCLPCGPGHYQNNSGAAECLECEPGTYSPTSGMPTCNRCPPGKKTRDFGSVYCTICEMGYYQTEEGGASCLPCAEGSYSLSSLGGRPCIQCAGGSYADIQALTSCKECQAGMSTNRTGASSCQSCPPGKFAQHIGELRCDECPVGKYSDVSGGIACKLCPPGKATKANQTGVVTCDLCPAGRHNDREGSFSCVPCGPGYYSQEGSSECLKCNQQTANPWHGMPDCFLCDDRSQPNLLRTECECFVGTYATRRQDANGESLISQPGAKFECKTCPRGASCKTLGRTFDTLETARGYWRASTESLEYFTCLLPEHCLGGINSTCALARIGPLCATCEAGFTSGGFSKSGECERCPENKGTPIMATTLIALGVCAALVVMFWVVVKSDGGVMDLLKEQMREDEEEEEEARRLGNIPKERGEGLFVRVGAARRRALAEQGAEDLGKVTRAERAAPNFTYKMKILLSFMQILTSLSFAVDAPWPSLFREFVRFFSFVNLDFLPWGQIGCLTVMTFYTKVMIVCIVPVGAFAVFGLFYVLPMLYIDRRGMKKIDKYTYQRKRQLTHVNQWKLSLFTLFLLYPYVSSMVLKMFICREVRGEYRLQADFSLFCFDEQWMSHLGFIIPMVLLYPIGVPVIFFACLYAHRDRLLYTSTRAKFGFLYAAYFNGSWWMEMVNVLYKLFMTSMIGFFDPSIQMPIAMVAVLVYLDTLLIVKPYLRKGEDRLHGLVCIEIFSLILCVYIVQSTGEDWDPTMDLVISLLLITLSISTMLVAVVMSLRNLKKMCNSLKRGKQAKTGRSYEFKADFNESSLGDLSVQDLSTSQYPSHTA